MRNILLLVALVSLFACKNEISEHEIIDRAIVAHGGGLFESKLVKFDFRSKSYSIYHDNHDIIFTKSFPYDSLSIVNDTLINNRDMVRYVNNEKIELTDKQHRAYANSLNSVLYFFQLPYGLNGPAVNKTLLSKNMVSGKMYHKVKVTFNEEGGGEDFEDVFIYWINDKEYTVDYLAYSYKTNGGGLRFRQAVNRRDYLNYKPIDESTPLSDLDKMFETGQLTQLSVIENKNVIVTNLSER